MLMISVMVNKQPILKLDREVNWELL